MKRPYVNLFALVGALAALLVAVAPASAAGNVAFNADCGPGTVTIGVSTSGQLTASWEVVPCAGSRLGQATTTGIATITGTTACGGFTTADRETITSQNGDTLTVTVNETSCPSAPGSNTFICAGSYFVNDATGKLAVFEGTTGKWAASLTVSGFNAGDTGTFHSTFSN